MSLIFRYDDFCSHPTRSFEKDRWIFQLFSDLRIPLIVGVIPDVSNDGLDSSNRIYYPIAGDVRRTTLLKEAFLQGWEIALHGLTHQGTTYNPRTEFANQFPSHQLAKIEKGVEILKQVIPDAEIKTFIPPWNTYDKTTVVCLVKSGFNALCVGSQSGEDRHLGLRTIPSLLDTTSFFQYAARFSLEELRRVCGDGRIVVTLHEYSLGEKSSLGQVSLDDFSRLLHRAKYLGFSAEGFGLDDPRVKFRPQYWNEFQMQKLMLDGASAKTQSYRAALNRAICSAGMKLTSADTRLFLPLSRLVWNIRGGYKTTRRRLSPIKRVGSTLLSCAQTIVRPKAGSSIHRCPICGYVGPFVPFGVLSKRPHAKCIRCNSLERHRFLHYMLSIELNGLASRNRALVVAPDPLVRILSEHFKCVLTTDLADSSAQSLTNLESLPFVNNVFDLIIAVHVFDEIINEESAIRECYRTLAPGGWLIAPVPKVDSQTTIELNERRRDGKVRLAGSDYYDRFISKGFKLKTKFVTSDFPIQSELFQWKLYSYDGSPPLDDEAVILRKSA